MKKKLTDNQKRLILCLVIVIIFTSAYQFIYTKYEDTAQNYNNKADAAKKEIAVRESDLSQKDNLTKEITEINQSIDGIINEFPVKLMKEDNLIFIEDMERALNMDIPSVDVLDPKEFYTTVLPIRNQAGLDMLESVSTKPTDTGTTQTQDTATTTDTTITADANASTDTQIQYMKALVCPINISFQTTEQKFIKLLDYIALNPERASVAGTSLDYDSSSGELICNMTINRYVLIGSGKDYKEPDIGNISIGTDNLFGTGK